jgi:hypothetical protein
MCIVNEGWDIGRGPDYGDIDEVISESVLWGEKYYELSRFKGYGFQADKFIPLPDAEPETVTEEETQLATA